MNSISQRGCITKPRCCGTPLPWVGALDNAWDHVKVRLRNIDANNYLDLYWMSGYFVMMENVSGTGPTALPLLDYVGDDADVWYDVYVQLDDDVVVVYAGERGQAMTKIVDTTTDVTSSTDRIQFTVENVGANGSQFLFDDIKVMTRELSDKTMTMTYGAGNQLTNIVRGDGVEIDLAYDAWGRVSHADMIVPGVDTFTMDYTYWFGDKLKRVETDIPGMPAVVHYLYDGLGKRRVKVVDDEDIIHYRWNAGYNLLAEYEDGNTTAWDIEGFKRFFVPMLHTALAEATPDGTGDPAAGTYAYIAHDRLDTGRFAYNQAKAQIGTVEHDPYGERITQTGYTPYHEFTGKPFDSETGMYYFPYRYYHPHISRWTTPDPAGLIDGPNVYGYVKGNPAMKIDKYGLQGGCMEVLTFIGVTVTVLLFLRDLFEPDYELISTPRTQYSYSCPAGYQKKEYPYFYNDGSQHESKKICFCIKKRKCKPPKVKTCGETTTTVYDVKLYRRGCGG
jgi:RHS repeat-associated protein